MSTSPSESIREAREHLATIVDRADRDGEPTIITRRGREVAAVVSIELLREYRILEEQAVLRMIAERHDEPTVSMEEVLAETLARAE
jgi:prevent-host-death family protein